ncbi:uncharacterized protein LOC116350218 [Contarinia nasturtii]|uniref:uncharacterized protein LOC116350218 n=1 Tax=Contarinia nasturtii TaxID=265458 RepID=UPI0012D3EE54|nr:uncharacterized protein LOC116350218 [Contarinia nasturtii]
MNQSHLNENLIGESKSEEKRKDHSIRYPSDNENGNDSSIVYIGTILPKSKESDSVEYIGTSYLKAKEDNAYSADISADSGSSWSFNTPPDRTRELRLLYAGLGSLISDERLRPPVCLTETDGVSQAFVTSTPKSKSEKGFRSNMTRRLSF